MNNFTLTEEQKAIVEYEGNQVIGAGAGCAKTTTMIFKAKHFPNLKKLYFAFNSGIVQEMKRKVDDFEIERIDVATFHSFAHTKFIKSGEYKLGNNLSVYGVSKEFGLKGDFFSNKIVTHSLKWFDMFCNSDLDTLEDLKYLDTIESEKSHKFVESHLEHIHKITNDLWSKMDKGKIDCTHSFYLKKYQLTKPKLNYDLIFIDESQDLSPVQLDIVKSLNGVKVVVGDSNQAIYGWRGAVNAMEAFPDFKRFTLSESFRCHQGIADLGLKALSYKDNYDEDFDSSKLRLIGKGRTSPEGKIKTRGILSRSNISLLEYIFSNIEKYENFYIEGGIESLIKTQSGIAMSDLVYLEVGEVDKIQNFFIKKFPSLDKLQEYYEDLDDTSLDAIIRFVRRYKKFILAMIVKINEKLIDKKFAEVIFSTLHKSKGQEYDIVQILPNKEKDDCFPYEFPSKKKDKLTGEEVPLDEIDKKRYSAIAIEELNLRYVAVTRAKYRVTHSWDYLDIESKEEVEQMQAIKKEIQS